MGKKILVPCLDVTMIAFFAKKYTVKDHISHTKLEKGDHHTSSNTAQGSSFPLQSYSEKPLRKNFPESARKYSLRLMESYLFVRARKFWSVEFGIRKKMLVESEIQLKEPSFTDKDWNSLPGNPVSTA